MQQRSVAGWRIESDNSVRVWDPDFSAYVPTGFTALPNVWNEISAAVDVNSQTWEFYFNDQKYAKTLDFRNPHVFVDRVTIGADSATRSYVDNVRISIVPEPSTYALALAGFAGVGLVGWRKRR